MAKFKDAVRFVILSPEMLAGLSTVLIAYLWPETIDFAAKFISVAEAPTASVVIGVPIAMLIGGYRLGFDVLNPTEQEHVLKQWPDYWMIRNRVIFSCVIGALGVVATIIAYFLANNGFRWFGTLVIAICWVITASSVTSLAYARLSVRDVLNTKS